MPNAKHRLTLEVVGVFAHDAVLSADVCVLQIVLRGMQVSRCQQSSVKQTTLLRTEILSPPSVTKYPQDLSISTANRPEAVSKKTRQRAIRHSLALRGRQLCKQAERRSEASTDRWLNRRRVSSCRRDVISTAHSFKCFLVRGKKSS